MVVGRMLVGQLKPVPLLLSLLLSPRNLDIDLNQQALVQLSPPPLPKLNQRILWVMLMILQLV